ncbi:MAG: hypothetical protein V3T70_11970 [Phycisphaerae bacterium]
MVKDAEAPARNGSSKQRSGLLSYGANSLIPGTGLILNGRPWLGAALALLFGICAHVTIAGWLVAPLAWPRWLTWIAALLTAANWPYSTILLAAHRRAPGADGERVNS